MKVPYVEVKEAGGAVKKLCIERRAYTACPVLVSVRQGLVKEWGIEVFMLPLLFRADSVGLWAIRTENF